jgi:hypothetical protein
MVHQCPKACRDAGVLSRPGRRGTRDSVQRSRGMRDGVQKSRGMMEMVQGLRKMRESEGEMVWGRS